MSWSADAFEAVAQLVNRRTGLHFLPSRQDSAEAGIRRAMARARVADPARYHALLLTNDTAFDALVGELTVGETYFFREPAQFEFIRREVLPTLRRRDPASSIRAWSAACASGEEAYSLAILFEQEGLADLSYVHGTDISRPALERARQAVYSNWSLRGSGAALAQPYLTRRNDRLVLADKIRRRVTCAYLNLALDVYPSSATNTWGMDLILCRNVLIYMDAETVRRVAGRLFESLSPGGWLFTASADPPLHVEAPMETVVTSAGVFYRRQLAGLGVTGGHGIRTTADLGRQCSVPGTQYSVPSTRHSDLGTPFSAPAADCSALSPQPSALSTYDSGPVTEALEPPKAPLTETRAALGRGDYARAAALTGSLLTDIPTTLLHVQALANVDIALAERACAAALARQPLATELHFLYAVLLLNLGRDKDSMVALRRVLYLDRSLAIAHFMLGSLLKQQGDPVGARRAYRNARDLAAALPTDEVLSLADGEQAGQLVEAATFQLSMLDSTQGATS